MNDTTKAHITIPSSASCISDVPAASFLDSEPLMIPGTEVIGDSAMTIPQSCSRSWSTSQFGKVMCGVGVVCCRCDIDIAHFLAEQYLIWNGLDLRTQVSTQNPILCKMPLMPSCVLPGGSWSWTPLNSNHRCRA